MSSSRAAIRTASMAWTESQRQAVDQLVLDAAALLRTLSIPSPTLTATGNSERLVRKLGRVHRTTSPQSKARALVAVLDEVLSLAPIPNDEVRALLAGQIAKSNDEAVQLITNLERTLRSCVRSRLGRTSPDWWSSRVPSSVRRRADRSRQKAEAVYPNVSAPEDPLSYVSFGEYDDIILDGRNWEECFVAVFEDRAWIAIKLRELEPIRNTLMHSRNLTQHGLEKLRVVSRDILERLKRT